MTCKKLYSTVIQKLSLKQTLQAKLKDSMKSQNKFESTVLKSVISDIGYAEKASNASGGHVDSSSILLKAIDKRKDAFEQFTKVSRDDLAGNEQMEIKFLEQFVPKAKTNAELEALVKLEIQNLAGIDNKKKFPQAMKALTAKLSAAEAPRQLLAELIKKSI